VVSLPVVATKISAAAAQLHASSTAAIRTIRVMFVSCLDAASSLDHSHSSLHCELAFERRRPAAYTAPMPREVARHPHTD
jgi:hypothetical protein